MKTMFSGLPNVSGLGRLAAVADALRAGRAGAGAPGVQPQPGSTAPTAPRSGSSPEWLNFVPAELRSRVASHLPTGLPDHLGGSGAGFGWPGIQAGQDPIPGTTDLPDGARFLARSFSNEAGSRPYKLYVPSGYNGQPVALVVMLHGCTQTPDDFAAGTGMNAAAEEQVFLVVYPGQTMAANAQRCWKWFSAEDQQRGRGEPALIAGITGQIIQEYAVDPRRVYVAGLSAGGAAASVLAAAYPDLYAAIGVHSGLACGAASDLPSALTAMKRGSGGGAHHRSGSAAQRVVPAIVFHGDRDATVSPRNGVEVVEQATGPASRAQTQQGQASGGLAYSRTVHLDEAGQAGTELWLIHGAGHAWSGGSAAGSYTDPRGPDATREMLRFFWAHPHPAPGVAAATAPTPR
ncbi:MAG: PHB depolymerase family esterase [Acetobacteraceae bacterium]